MPNPCRVLEPFVLEANTLFGASLAQNTWKSYENALGSFYKFRQQYFLNEIWPPPVDHITSFIAFLAYNSYSPSTAKSYISGLSFALKCRNIEDTTQSFIVKHMLRGMTRLHGIPDTRLPITIDMMLKFPNALLHVCSSRYEAVLFNAAFSLAFAALLRVGEFTCTNVSDSAKIIQNSDLRLNDFDKSCIIKVKYSKTDQIGRCCVVQINSNNGLPFSTFSALKEYMQVRPIFNGPLFCHLNRKYVTRRQFLVVLHSSLKFMGYNIDKINTHSFRIGAATYLSKLGVSDDEIKNRGRWSSNSVKRYIRL